MNRDELRRLELDLDQALLAAGQNKLQDPQKRRLLAAVQNRHTRRLLAAAENLELWAIWPDPKLPDGYGAMLLVSPDDDRTETHLATLHVASFDQAMEVADALASDPDETTSLAGLIEEAEQEHERV